MSNDNSNHDATPKDTEIPPEAPRTMFTCAYDGEGGAHFNYSGVKPNLIEMMGLWVHAGFSMFDLWQQTFGKKQAEGARIVKPR